MVKLVEHQKGQSGPVFVKYGLKVDGGLWFDLSRNVVVVLVTAPNNKLCHFTMEQSVGTLAASAINNSVDVVIVENCQSYFSS